MDRRKFSTMLAIASATPSTLTGAAMPTSSQPELLHLKPNGWMPNNPDLPVLLYRSAFPANSRADLASTMEAAFEKNGWPPQWRNGVYDFHHYHSTAHEVLGFARGTARLILGGEIRGGEGGHELTVQAGDVALLPTGTGHCKIEASPDFLVIGAYPPGEHWDICRTAPDPATLASMKTVAFPDSDPVSGKPLAPWRGL